MWCWEVRREYGELAQLGERLVCIQEVAGSSPVFSTNTESITLFDLDGIARGLRGSVGVGGVHGPLHSIFDN